MAYSDWHPLHPPDKELAVPYHRIFGRLFERDAMAYFLKADPKELLGLDLGWRAVLKGREYAQEHDERISQEVRQPTKLSRAVFCHTQPSLPFCFKMH
jgi:hypothetical protein